MNSKKFAMLAAGFAMAFALNAQEADSAATPVESVEADMVLVDGGSFFMGSRNNEDNETPVHEVSVDSYYLLNTEVTQKLYRDVMGTNVSHFKGDEHPVEEVSWYDAVIFCNKLSVLAGLEPVYTLDGSTDTDSWGNIPRIDADADEKARWNAIAWNPSANGYRLPTEAEWEYAAKGGIYAASDTLYSGSNVISDVAWNADDPSGETHDVAAKSPNSLGLFDMSGNVWEWVWDWYGNYHVSDSENPKGAAADVTGRKMRRGGSINSDAVFCRNANRASSVPELRGIDLGFRVARSASDSVDTVEK
ncbi:MAG: SUMF1/EgtB/PvdO family nonheme iron enzyme [Treponema sp.]|nr:SUMF1/EgtB/PvdO family nonheme iron enzyme [Treponema sp.]MBQ5385341.1 SUMF1/EgtB/PvdO family nonheme iron enzyme [Treponema sp.]